MTNSSKKQKLQRVNGVVIYVINLIDCLGLRPFLFVLCVVHINLSNSDSITWSSHFSLVTEAKDWSEKKHSEKGLWEGNHYSELAGSAL